ncbi:DUF6786 family protein [Rudanella lutea]|uniref:DUF6786 family protein n=1 Tax=Rudanella lutea TaxID=451374 RepID=UPI000377CFF7|nr:DUF6786 family protein [Rudanella lutea]
MKPARLLPCLYLMAGLVACTSANQPSDTMNQPGTFGYDLQFLKAKDPDLALLTDPDDSLAQVIVSARYQGKVFTSTANGAAGQSFGWVNYKAFEGEPQPHMNAYGGENRLWLGPEGGQYSLFFKPGTRMEFANWQTPAAIDTEPWTVVSRQPRELVMEKKATLLNYSGTQLAIRLDRAVRLLSRQQVGEALGMALGDDIRPVGYLTENALTNIGTSAWTRETGAPCLWVLDMLMPSDQTTIVVPYEQAGTGPVVTTDYFGAIPPERITYQNGVLFFKADGKSRGKIGLTGKRAKPVAGSYDAGNEVLTLTLFEVDKEGTYLNQAWKLVPAPYLGDAVNAYNDGPLADGSQMGPFYELESVSPGAFLGPGGSLRHTHKVLHLTGDRAKLDEIARKVLGVSLDQIRKALP